MYTRREPQAKQIGKYLLAFDNFKAPQKSSELYTPKARLGIPALLAIEAFAEVRDEPGQGHLRLIGLGFFCLSHG